MPDPRAEYGRIRAAHLAAVSAALEDHLGRLEWSRAQIERHSGNRLRALLAYARERSPFHAARLAGLDPASAELAAVPVMTKQQAQNEWDAVITVPDLNRARAERILAEQQWFSYTEHNQQVFSSGGSSGVRGVYVWDWPFFISAACLAWRMQARDELHDPVAGESRLAVLTAAVPPHASTPLFDVPTRDGMRTTVIEAGAPFDRVLAEVAAVAPTHIAGYATVIGRLARATLAGELAIRPRRVSTNSEPLLPEDRVAIGQAWGATIHNLWGSTEIGVQAVGCGYDDGLHVCEDEVILERVDGDGMPVAPDEPAARTLATGLANRTFPFIRYDLGDEITFLPGRCPCGSAFARVADVTGRRDDDFTYTGITVPASAFRHVLGTDSQVTEYQVTQTTTGAEILVVGQPDPVALSRALATAMRRYGLRHPTISVAVVEQLPRRRATGKLTRFVPLR
ncbi:phenylacetate--CoA ligase family protein [Mycobacterium sp. CVI_P3]|uniref:Phenylacetate--CoA ligase family protein n=1 Tax=Mycobacterium pinniadriaticum TaxID=2994102 RepID=A0ABT3SIT5_9MYCO|nr:phenylacetate--CoA ligase family protein [Mycobacterium pinniadriaticum]MCX2933029.1 phenylacetate--CoA ligase family protein [Mycobacterium pinniadriaticum]MCX2939451.1 phenylacetate--CoA ligase family protein [Mycobacterium pinniadriaticum]